MADIKKKLVDGAGLQAAMGIMADFADKGVRGSIGGYNQSFPLTAATKGNIYYHKGTNRYYICVDNYNGSSLTNPNSKFEELSVYTNRQRLDNLFGNRNYIFQNKKVLETHKYSLATSKTHYLKMIFNANVGDTIRLTLYLLSSTCTLLRLSNLCLFVYTLNSSNFEFGLVKDEPL